MPRIRRWHPVSHDLIRDREFQSLLKIHAMMGYVWIEMLAEGDKKEGKVVGTAGEIASHLAWIVSSKHSFAVHKILTGLSLMVRWGWIEQRQDHFYICNYPDYHPRREQASSLLPSLLPSKQKDRPLRGLVPRPELTPLELIESWNEICGTEGLSKVEQVTNGRQAKARARIKRYPKSEFWGQVLNGIIQSDYLMGRKRKEGDTWRPDFDWLVRNDENPAKVMEGKYD